MPSAQNVLMFCMSVEHIRCLCAFAQKFACTLTYILKYISIEMSMALSEFSENASFLPTFYVRIGYPTSFSTQQFSNINVQLGFCLSKGDMRLHFREFLWVCQFPMKLNLRLHALNSIVHAIIKTGADFVNIIFDVFVLSSPHFVCFYL